MVTKRNPDLKSYKKPADDSSFVEPPSAASEDNPPMYPYNNITATASGHVFELDDTPKGERIRLKHRSGTFIEMHPDGDEVHKIYGDGYEITVKNKNVYIGGVCNITIKGDSLVNYQGNRKEIVEKDYSIIVKGDYTLSCKKEIGLYSTEDMTLAGGIPFIGSINLFPGSHVHINGDLEASGHIDALSVGATRIDATLGVGAGLLGVFSVGPITSLATLTAPLGSFGISSSIWMTDYVNSLQYMMHWHPTPKGPSGTPAIPFLGF